MLLPAIKTTALFLAALLPGLALAETTLYGEINSSFNASRSQSNAFDGHRRNGITDNGSHIGLRGSHSLGGGNRLIWQTEQSASNGYSGSTRNYMRQRKENSVFTR